MITALLLLPVTAVLAWVYARALPKGERWSLFDTALLLGCAIAAGAWVAWARSAEYVDAGPIFPELVAAAGAYPLILLGLGGGLAWRYRRFRRREERR